MSQTISFQIKALQSDATTPIPNAEIQLENSNLGQNPKTDSQGIASFEIESTQHLKPFRAKLIHKDYQEYPISDRVIILNSIKRREKPLELRFRGKLWLFFNGESLSIMAGKDKILKTYTVYSGKALSPQEAQNLQQEYNYTSFVTHTNKGLFSDEILYFCLDTEWQREKDKGAMPEGTYYIDINDIQDSWSVFSENKFGKNTRIYTDKDCTNTRESTTQRENFYLHGGDKYGNAGGIDLAKEDTSFFNYLATLKVTHIYDSIYVKREKKCIVKLVVEYENRLNTNDIASINNPSIYVVVNEMDTNRYYTRKVYKVFGEAEKVFKPLGLSSIDILQQMYPDKYGLVPTDFKAQNSVSEHVIEKVKHTSRFVSVSELQQGAQNYRGNLIFIDKNELMKLNIKIYSTDDIIKILNATESLSESEKERFKNIVIQDKEVLLEPKQTIPKHAIVSESKMNLIRNLETTGKYIQVVGIFMTIYDLEQATEKSIKQHSPKPLIAEAARQVGGWGGAISGARMGFGVGLAFGLETGPGVVFTSLGCAIVFGILGYNAGNVIGDIIEK